MPMEFFRWTYCALDVAGLESSVLGYYIERYRYPATNPYYEVYLTSATARKSSLRIVRELSTSELEGSSIEHSLVQIGQLLHVRIKRLRSNVLIKLSEINLKIIMKINEVEKGLLR